MTVLIAGERAYIMKPDMRGGTEPSRAVDAKLHRQFSTTESRAAVIASLARIDAETENGRARVRLAVLKLSDGDPQKVERFVESAVRDFRDVLAWAESPNVMSLSPGVSTASSEYQTAMAADTEQYEMWLSS